MMKERCVQGTWRLLWEVCIHMDHLGVRPDRHVWGVSIAVILSLRPGYEA